jgi:cation diffusion facilitator family transporter
MGEDDRLDWLVVLLPSCMVVSAQRGIRSAQIGLLINAALAVTKLIAGLVGNAYALVADAIESGADILSSVVVWGGLAISSQPADEDHPFGHGKAEPLAAAVVSLMLIGAAVGISIEAASEIRTPHHSPAAWTLGVLVGVMLIKFILSFRVRSVGADLESTAVKADAAHHLSDAITSAAAFVGISVAVVGGPGWEAADDWAALVAAAIIAFNGVVMLRPALHDLMDRAPGEDAVKPVRDVASAVPGVLAVEKLFVRRTGMTYRVTIHVQADPHMPLDEAHALGGRVKRAILGALPRVQYVLVHMEPFEG